MKIPNNSNHDNNTKIEPPAGRTQGLVAVVALTLQLLSVGSITTTIKGAAMLYYSCTLVASQMLGQYRERLPARARSYPYRVCVCMCTGSRTSTSIATRTV